MQLGYPIIGDKLYNQSITKEAKGLFLRSINIEFEHPITNQKMKFASDLPKKFTKFLKFHSRNNG
jgi:23S rRNA-/tRNA-specific pseudouridylate synthase